MNLAYSVRQACKEQRSLSLVAFNLVCAVLLGGCILYVCIQGGEEAVTLAIGQERGLSAVYKGARANPDGTVDIIFNVPKLPRELMLMNMTGGAGGQNALHSKQSNVLPEVAATPRVYVRTKYPLTLFTDFLINPVHLCPSGRVDYLVLVHSATAYFERRRAIRETFGGRSLFGHVTQRVVFLMGTTSDKDTSRAIRQEAVEFGDIVQGPFIDSYHNLTHKGVMGLRWTSEFCSQADVIIKIDDDVFLNVFRVVEDYLPIFKNSTRKIGCHLRKRGTSPITRGSGKWQVTQHEFKELEHYPFDYCNGYCVFMSRDLIRPMVNAARVNPFFWIDDVYLFGMLPATVGNPSFMEFRYEMTLSYDDGKQCVEKNGAACKYMAVSQWRTEGHNTLWYTLAANLTDGKKKELHLFDMS